MSAPLVFCTAQIPVDVRFPILWSPHLINYSQVLGTFSNDLLIQSLLLTMPGFSYATPKEASLAQSSQPQSHLSKPVSRTQLQRLFNSLLLTMLNCQPRKLTPISAVRSQTTPSSSSILAARQTTLVCSTTFTSKCLRTRTG
jgi:hypothetical protein